MYRSVRVSAISIHGTGVQYATVSDLWLLAAAHEQRAFVHKDGKAEGKELRDYITVEREPDFDMFAFTRVVLSTANFFFVRETSA